MTYNADDIKPLLIQNFESLILDIFPTAHKHAGHYSVGSLAGEPGDSLVLWIGNRAGAWKEHNGSDQGDVFNLIMKTQGLNFSGAVAWGAQWLGVDSKSTDWEVVKQEAAARAKRQNAKAVREAEENRTKAEKLWLYGKQSVKGTPVELYLAGRSIDLKILKKQPGAIRYHPECWHYQLNKKFPAMVICITDPSKPKNERFRAVHRTYLQRTRQGGFDRLRGENVKAKLVKGLFVGASIPIWRGKSGKSLADMPEGEAVYITEGPEDALSLAIANPAARIICGVSLANLGNVWLPPQAGPVTLVKDNDWNNPKAEEGFQRAIEAHCKMGRIVKVMKIPGCYGKDVNDMLAAGDL